MTCSASDVDAGVHGCHGGICRRWTGGPAFAVSVGAVTFSGADHIGRYDSSVWAERGFCKRCGPNLFYRLKEADHYVLWMGAFDNPAAFRIGSGAWYRDVLGFRVDEIGDPGWRMFSRDGCRIMAGQCPDAIPAADLGDHSCFAYLMVVDAAAYHAEVVAAAADLIKPLRDEPWSVRESGLRSVDGQRIMSGEDLD